jgi:hypothetical protein
MQEAWAGEYENTLRKPTTMPTKKAFESELVYRRIIICLNQDS